MTVTDRLLSLAAGFTFRMPAIVERVIDGDTIVAHIAIMPGLTLHSAHIRVEGMNAPEMNTAAGQDAHNFAAELMPPATALLLTMTREDKYGRRLARVNLPDGRDLTTVMITAGHAVPFMV